MAGAEGTPQGLPGEFGLQIPEGDIDGADGTCQGSDTSLVGVIDHGAPVTDNFPRLATFNQVEEILHCSATARGEARDPLVGLDPQQRCADDGDPGGVVRIGQGPIEAEAVIFGAITHDLHHPASRPWAASARSSSVGGTS